jgi:cytochrome P450
VGFNPYSHEFHDDPFPFYRELRDDAPVYYNDELNFYALSRYDDVLDALHDPETYCSRFGIALEDSNPLPMLLMTDPPEHTRLRRIISGAFTPRRVADLEAPIRGLVCQYAAPRRRPRSADSRARLPVRGRAGRERRPRLHR